MGGVTDSCQPKLSFMKFTRKAREVIKMKPTRQKRGTKSFTETKFRAHTDFSKSQGNSDRKLISSGKDCL